VTTPGRFAGRVVLITGAARGQGQVHAECFAREGADIIATDFLAPKDVEAGFAETLRLVERAGRKLVAMPADVRDADAMLEVTAKGASDLGGLDVVVANAGVATSVSSLDETDGGWRRTLDVNLTGVWNTCRAAIPHLLARGRGGSIVITGSTQAFKASPNLAAYSASKHGVIGLMKTLAIEFAEHMIRVNSVHPTTVRTPMMDELMPDGLSPDELVEYLRPVNALPVPWVEPVDVSNAVLFLASDDARYITGASLPVDAGALLVGGSVKKP
jgi:SDR family mycofactocin-dependent oxidoreductase